MKIVRLEKHEASCNDKFKFASNIKLYKNKVSTISIAQKTDYLLTNDQPDFLSLEGSAENPIIMRYVFISCIVSLS